jgi:MoaA/NifB/PqqE/SkfB family radical SAM enzyme
MPTPSAVRRGALIGRLLRAHEIWVRWVYAPILGLFCAIFVRVITRRGRGSVAALARLGAWATRPSSCCPPGSPDDALNRRFRAILAAITDRRHLAALLDPPRIATTRRWMTAILRISVLQEIRHGLLVWLRAQTGAPAVALMDAQIAVAPDCELACTGCYALPGHGGPEPTTASVLAAVDETAALGATAIHLIGKGEPLAPRERGLAVARAIAARPQLLFTVATSGTGVHEDVVRALADAGNVFVFVSIDGPPEAHAARRGEGSLDEARATMAKLRSHGVPFGFSTMVSRASIPLIADPDLVAALVAEGCLLGAYVRYFPLSPGRAPALLLRPSDVEAWRAALDRIRSVSAIPLVDLDELEDESGCRSRHGKSLYIDAIHGDVAPCLRVPFAPPGAARLGEAPLDTILRHPFFEGYRARAGERCHSCGHGLERELVDVEADLRNAGCAVPALSSYRSRAGARSLPIAPRIPEPEEPRAHEDVSALPAAE